jgi:MIP family channel proteins
MLDLRTTLGDAIAEALGVFTLCFVGILAIQNLADAPGGLVGIAFAHGLAIAVMVAAFGHISGGHFNPAVTLGVLLGGKIHASTAVVFWVAQLLGGLLAALLVAACFDTDVVASGTPVVADGVGMFTAIVLEAVATFVLVVVVYGTAVDARAPASVYPFAIGLSITVGILAIGPYTGGALNPARGFGPALVGGEWGGTAAWVIGPLVGGALAALLHSYVITPAEAAKALAAAGEQPDK